MVASCSFSSHIMNAISLPAGKINSSAKIQAFPAMLILVPFICVMQALSTSVISLHSVRA
jgi:hypothetical protein